MALEFLQSHISRHCSQIVRHSYSGKLVFACADERQADSISQQKSLAGPSFGEDHFRWQTGVDRAALDFAISNGIPHGGWCPQGRAAEDGELAELYSLDETPGADYAQSTEWNMRDSNGTVIFSIAPKLFGGSEFTAEVAKRLNKPCLHISKSVVPHTGAKRLKDFVLRNHIRVLNVAGPRASNEPNVAEFVHETLKKFFRHPKSSDR